MKRKVIGIVGGGEMIQNLSIPMISIVNTTNRGLQLLWSLFLRKDELLYFTGFEGQVGAMMEDYREESKHLKLNPRNIRSERLEELLIEEFELDEGCWTKLSEQQVLTKIMRVFYTHVSPMFWTIIAFAWGKKAILPLLVVTGTDNVEDLTWIHIIPESEVWRVRDGHHEVKDDDTIFDEDLSSLAALEEKLNQKNALADDDNNNNNI